jgi:hypothetical protein
MVEERRCDVIQAALRHLRGGLRKTTTSFSQITFSRKGIRTGYIGIQTLCNTFYVILTVNGLMFRIFLNQQNSLQNTLHYQVLIPTCFGTKVPTSGRLSAAKVRRPNKCYQALFTLTFIIKAKCHKMSKPQITHQQVYVQTAATTPHTVGPPLVNNYSRFSAKKKTAVIVCTLTGALCWCLKLQNLMRYLCTKLTATNTTKDMSDVT